MDYVNLSYRPTKNDLIVEYYCEPNRVPLQVAASNVALESSIGTWTTISTMNPHIAKKLKPSVFSINKKTNTIKIAYPQQLFEPRNMPQILSAIAGNIYGMKIVKNLRLQDITFPKKLVASFPGPRFGIVGIRKLTKVKNRPLVGTIVKPKVGLTAKQHAQVAYNAWIGGLDVVKDDENLTSMSFNNFYDRIKLTLAAKKKAEKLTGEKKIYLANVTAECLEMLKRADYVQKLGGEYVMVDILTCGFSGLQTLCSHSKKLFIHAHRAMHAALTKNPKHGMSMLAIAKITRLIGCDQLHIGTAFVGKMGGSSAEAADIEDEIESSLIVKKEKAHVLEQKWYGIKPILAVASGGLHPGSIPKVIQRMGTNIVIQFGGGCHGHPDGTTGGATAIRQALDASLKKIPLKVYAKTHPELAKAIAKWGVE